MKKQIFTLLLVICAPLFLYGTAFAQSVSGAGNVTNQSSPASSFQNAGTGTQAQNTAGINSSAGADVLNQEPTNTLTVNSGPLPNSKALDELTFSKSTSAAWIWYLVIALLFLVAAIILFTLGRKRQQTERATVGQEKTEPKPIIEITKAKTAVRHKSKKPNKKKTSKTKRRKRR
jgi:flagellar basal body-associated protein FliL